MDLPSVFSSLNEVFFDGFLDVPVLRWNSRLRASAGRFFPGVRRGPFKTAPVIEVATYLQTEANAESLIRDTIAHEMVHYWLWVRRRPYGHTEEFLAKLKQIGGTRYNPVPRLRPARYLYVCLECKEEFWARRKLGPSACRKCCKRHNQGRYDVRFKLVLQESTCTTIEPS